jgi:hypothetical protein
MWKISACSTEYEVCDSFPSLTRHQTSYSVSAGWYFRHQSIHIQITKINTETSMFVFSRKNHMIQNIQNTLPQNIVHKYLWRKIMTSQQRLSRIVVSAIITELVVNKNDLSFFPPAISTCWLHKQNSYQSSRELNWTYQQWAGVITKFSQHLNDNSCEEPYFFRISPVPAELRRLFQHVIEVSNGPTCDMYLFFLLFPIYNWYFVVYL